MTELQEREFEILKLFVDICERLGLTYYLVCGSALGAAKYSGFIPWDDDIDVALPRPDYERFLSAAANLLPDWCFIQNYRTDPEFHLLGTKLRDSRTTYIEKMTCNLKINHGVFIDVFPLDGYQNNQKIFIKSRRVYEARRRIRLNYNRFSRENILNLRTNFYYINYKLFGLYSDSAKAAEKYENLLKSQDVYNSKIWCNYANSVSEREFSPREHYGSGTTAEFEGLPVRIPEKYDEYLTQKYGDWRADLNEEEKQGHHYYEICDLSRPYTYYC